MKHSNAELFIFNTLLKDTYCFHKEIHCEPFQFIRFYNLYNSTRFEARIPKNEELNHLDIGVRKYNFIHIFSSPKHKLIRILFGQYE